MKLDKSEKKSKDIVFINQDSGYLMVDIANRFCEKGYNCSLITGRLIERDARLNTSITVKKIKNYDRSTNISRILSWLFGSVQILALIQFKFRNCHLFIVSNPPFSTLLPLFFRNKFSLMIFDVFPDALIEFGITKKGSILHKVWTQANRKVYIRAEHIFTLTYGMKQALEQYVAGEKIDLIPLWTSNEFLRPRPKDNNHFIKDHNLIGKFVILYSGNFGLAHHIELIIDLASNIKDDRIIFVLIGGGPAENILKQRISKMDLRNCLLLPWQDIETLPYSLASADLAVVTLSENAARLGIPSKLFNYFSVGAPILSISGEGSELTKLVREYNVGKSFTSHQIGEMAEYINEIIDNNALCDLYHKNSLKASTNHTVKNVELITQYYV